MAHCGMCAPGRARTAARRTTPSTVWARPTLKLGWRCTRTKQATCGAPGRSWIPRRAKPLIRSKSLARELRRPPARSNRSPSHGRATGSGTVCQHYLGHRGRGARGAGTQAGRPAWRRCGRWPGRRGHEWGLGAVATDTAGLTVVRPVDPGSAQRPGSAHHRRTCRSGGDRVCDNGGSGAAFITTRWSASARRPATTAGRCGRTPRRGQRGRRARGGRRPHEHANRWTHAHHARAESDPDAARRAREHANTDSPERGWLVCSQQPGRCLLDRWQWSVGRSHALDRWLRARGVERCLHRR